MTLRPFLVPIKILQLLGIWQEGNSSTSYRIYGLILHLYVLEHGSFNQTVHEINLLKSGEITEFMETLSIALTCYVTIFKSLIFMKNLKNIKNLMNELDEFLKFSDFYNGHTRPHVIFYEKQIIKISNLKYTFHTAVCNLSLIIAIINVKERRLPFKTWFYFDYKNNVGVYTFLIIVEYFLSVYTVLINTSLDIFPVIFLCYALSILKELSHKISVMSENVRKSEVDIRKCIDLHVKIKEFCEKISENYAAHFMIQVFFSSLILCSSAYLLTRVSKIIN